jgi:hypothetical protein
MIEPNLNQLNQRLIEQVNNAGSIELPELSNEYPEFRIVPEDMLWLIAHDAKPRNGTLLLYSVGL